MAIPSIQFIDADEIEWEQKRFIYGEGEEEEIKNEENTDEEEEEEEIFGNEIQVDDEEDILKEEDEEDIEKLIEKKKNEILKKKELVEKMMRNQKIRDDLSKECKEIFQFFEKIKINESLKLLLKQMDLGLKACYLFENLDHLEKGNEILKELIQLMSHEMKLIKEKMELDEIRMEKIRKEQEIYLKKKKIRDGIGLFLTN
jgi:hypothetical protein